MTRLASRFGAVTVSCCHVVNIGHHLSALQRAGGPHSPRDELQPPLHLAFAEMKNSFCCVHTLSAPLFKIITSFSVS